MSETVTTGQSAKSDYTWQTSPFAWNSATASKEWLTANTATYTKWVDASYAWNSTEASAKTWASSYRADFWANIASTLDFVEARFSDVGLNKTETFATAESTPSKDVGLAKSEAFATTDSAANVATFDRQIAESWATAESNAKAIDVQKSETWANASASVRDVGLNKSETFATAESVPVKDTAKALSETFATAEGHSEVSTFDRQIAEAFATAEAIQNQATFDRQIAETFATAESKSFGASISLGETFATADGKAFDASKALSDTFASADAIGNVATFDRQVAETFATVESASRIAAFDRQIGESFATADSITKDAAAFFSEAFASVESLSNSTGKNVADGFSASDGVGNIAAFDRQIAEAWATADAFGRTAAFDRQIAESLVANEGFGTVSTFDRQIAEAFAVRGGGYTWAGAAFTWADAVGGGWSALDLVPKDVTTPKSEVFQTTDSVTNAAGYVRAISETVAFAEALTNNFDKAISEAFATTDQVSLSNGFIRDIAEAFQITEANTRTAAFDRQFAEAFQTTDLYSGLSAFDRQFAEAFSTAESVGNTVAFLRDYAESLAIAESKVLAPAIEKAEVFQIAEATTKATEKEISEVITVVESLGRIVAFDRAIAEGFGTTDALSKAMSLPFAEAFAVGDLVRRAADVTMSDLLVGTTDLDATGFADVLAAGSPVGFTPFKAFMEGDHEYKRAIIKATFETNTANQARVKEMKAIVDVPDIDDSGSAAVPIGGLTITFARTFNSLPEIVVSMKAGTVMARPRITDIQLTQFTVELIDSAGAGVAGNIGWNAQGY